MLTNGCLRCPVRVLAVLAADRYSVALLDNHGRRTRDDVTVTLAEYSTPIYSRPMDPPLRVLGLYDEEALATGKPSNGPAACPHSRWAAEAIVRGPRRYFEIVVPVSGPHWLRTLASGSAVFGDLLVGSIDAAAPADAPPPPTRSIGDLLYPAWLNRRSPR